MTTTTNAPRLILVTGAAGRIVHPLNPPEEVELLKPHGEVIEAELEKVETLLKACEDVDTVFHLAGQPSSSARWDSLLKDNIEGTYNIFLAAKKSGVKRVIYASSIHAVSGYPKDTQVKTNYPVNPGDLYGVSKCFGEALGRYMAEQEGLSTIAIRIGAFQPYSFLKDESKSVALIDIWLSQPDAIQLFERCIDAPLDLKFAIVHGLSRNIFNRMEINSTCELLGYDPQDNFVEAHESFKPLNIKNRLLSNHGQQLVINDGDDDDSKDAGGSAVKTRKVVDDDNSILESVGEPLVRRNFFDLNKLLQRRQSSSFTKGQLQYQQYALEAHNRHRARHCVSPLQLDDSLSRSAQNYAQHLANINRMVHSGASGLGENLYMKWSSVVITTIKGAEATDAWYNEINAYSFNRPGFSMATGHFTQVVWKGSRKLGVGFATTGDGKSLYVVAQYTPPGNYQGQFGQNVLPARC